MVFYINKQAVEIKTRFENAPLTSPNEACAAIGMLCRIYGLPIPEKREMVSEMKQDLHTAIDLSLIHISDGKSDEDGGSDSRYGCGRCGCGGGPGAV